MKYQRGLSLGGLMVWGIIFAIVALFAMKVAPSYLNYGKLNKIVKTTASQSGKEATVADVKKVFGKYAEVDGLTFDVNNLDITKEGGQIVINFNYEDRIPLVGNASLVLSYKGSSRQ